MCFLPQWRALFEHLNFQKCSENGVLLACWLRNVHVTTPCTSTSKLPKVLREWCAVSMLTSKCVSRHSDVHFLNISTSKSASRLVCFVHFDFEMCFVPQWRALFEHLNFQKCCEHVVPQQHAMFDRSADPAPAALASLLFYLPSHKTLENTHMFTVFRDFSTCSLTCIFLLTLSLLWSSFFFLSHSLTLPTSVLFHLSILSEVWLLKFLRLNTPILWLGSKHVQNMCKHLFNNTHVYAEFLMVLLLAIHPSPFQCSILVQSHTMRYLAGTMWQGSPLKSPN